MTAPNGSKTDMVAGPAPTFWVRDLISCLHATFATVVARAGADPLEVLGAAWRFLHIPGDVRPEEFYFPCVDGGADGTHGDLGQALAPHHALHARWWRPADPDDPWAEIRDCLRQGRVVIAAVDNFYLPFRPAFGDVHAAHLVIVFGVDTMRGVVHVLDAMPPAFQGAVPMDAFLRAWGSVNPTDVQDAFFSNSRIDRRCLDVWIEAPAPTLTPDLLGDFLRTDQDVWSASASAQSGLSGLAAFSDDLLARCASGDADALRELYPFGWGMQAQASLHGELLRRCGRAWRDPGLAGAGRAVEAVAHAWTGLRMTGAHGLADPRAALPDIRHHVTALRCRYLTAVEAVGNTAARL
jgi:hypothetical protein